MPPPTVIGRSPQGWLPVDYAGGGQTTVQGTMFTWLNWAARMRDQLSCRGYKSLVLLVHLPVQSLHRRFLFSLWVFCKICASVAALPCRGQS